LIVIASAPGVDFESSDFGAAVVDTALSQIQTSFS
jgi:hypothetical protein